MQKWALIFLTVFCLSACHKEIIAPNETTDLLFVKHFLNKSIEKSEMLNLDWSNANSIITGEKTIGYKVPFFKNDKDHYKFILVDAPNNSPRAVYRNEISYEHRKEGQFPTTIVNYNYASGVTASYDTKEMLQPNLPGIKMSNSLSILAAGFRMPAVTVIGIFGDDGSMEKPATLKGIKTYILAYLLGLDIGGYAGKVLDEVPNGIHFYNPLHDNSKDKSDAVIEWEIGK